jgi:CRP/FNR family transcriptional regulator, cyclic AMP receptor protein
MPADESLLADVPLFALLDADERRSLASVLEQHSVKAGETIFRLGDPGDCLYVVRQGRVEIFVKETTGERIVFTIVEPGDLFGELAIFDNGPRSANAVALEDSEMLVLDREALHLFIRSKPDAAMDLMAVMAKRIRSADDLLRYRFSRNPNEEIEEELSWVQKLANFIAEFSGSMTFLFLNAGAFLVWIIINLEFIPFLPAFDPYPFGLLTMAVSLEAIFLSIFVLLAQNLQAAKDRIRGDVEYEINLRAELEVAELHQKVDEMNARLLERLQKIEKSSKELPQNRPFST